MGVLERDAALATCRALIDRSRADETEVAIVGTRDAFCRFADVGPTQNADREKVEVRVRARLEGSGGRREGSAVGGSLEPAELDRTLERALALAECASPDPDLLELGGPVEVDEARPHPATAAHGFAEKAAWIRRAVEACRAADVLPAGLAQTTATSRTLATSRGRAVHACTSRSSFSLTASNPDRGDRPGGAGYAQATSHDVGLLDVDGVVERAVRKAVANRAPEPIEAGAYTVVLEPHAVSSLLLFMAYQGFGAQALIEQASFLCGRQGERAFAESVHIRDDPRHPLYPGWPFDGEGSPRRTTPLVDAGLVVGPVTDRATAAKLDVENTGHAVPQPSTAGPRPQNLVLEAGDKSLDELIAGVDRGLLVTQFHYTNLIEPRDLLLTGMTRNGTFLIENGVIGPAVRNLRFTQSLVEALANVRGVGDELEVCGALFDGEVIVPPLLVDDFHFTSTTDF